MAESGRAHRISSLAAGAVMWLLIAWELRQYRGVRAEIRGRGSSA